MKYAFLVLFLLSGCSVSEVQVDEETVHHAGSHHIPVGHDNEAPQHLKALHADHFHDDAREELEGHMYEG